MSSPPKEQKIEVTAENIERIAFECLEERKTNPGVLVGVTPELLLAIADKLRELEDAHAAADTAIFDDTFSIEDMEPN